MSEKYHSGYEMPKKIFCAYHPNQFLTNFCARSECLMPLCPSCISLHTEEHYQQSSQPLYQNLQESLNETKQSCFDNIKELEELCHIIKEVRGTKSMLQKQLHARITKIKQHFTHQFSSIIDLYEKQLYEVIMNDYKKDGFYQPRKTQKFEEDVQINITNLYKKIGMLKGDQCLAALIQYMSIDKPHISSFKRQVRDITTKHKKSKIQVLFDDDGLRQKLSQLFDEVISVRTVTYENQKANKKQRPDAGFISPQKSSRNSSRSRKSRIFNNQRTPSISTSPYASSGTIQRNSHILTRTEPKGKAKNYDYESLI